MCARYAFFSGMRAIADDFGAVPLPLWEPQFNLAPTDVVPGIVVREGVRVATLFRWGLVPSWAEDIGIGQRLINARGETVSEKPSFRAAFRSRRCVLPADGFYEWAGEKGSKRPYFIQRADGRPLAFAGLWEAWERGEEYLETCTVITTSANREMSEIHDRMPVVLEREELGDWLGGGGDVGRLSGMLDPMRDGGLVMREVGKAVGNPRASGPGLIVGIRGADADVEPGWGGLFED